MEVRAVAKFVRVQPLKVRQVAREVRGKNASQMVTSLRFHPSKGAFVLRKVLMSAMANAEENHGVDSRNLKIKEIRVDEGPKMKRIQARAMGRANRIFKRMSHITVVVEDYEPEAAVKPHGTQPKARPSLAVKAGKKSKAASKAKEEVVTEEVVAEAEVEEVVEESGVEDVKAEAGADEKAPEGEEK